MQESLIDQGINLMLYGMGTVFVFLTILVFATGLMSKLVNRLASQQTPKIVNTEAADASSPLSLQPSQQVLEAIKQAIKLHRDR